MIKKALNKNNLFGVNAVDRDPSLADTYTSAEQSVEVLSRDYLNLKYIPLGDSYNCGNGSHLGSKYRGVNVRPEASTTKTQFYRYTSTHNLHHVVALVSSEQKSDYLWHKIVSDHIDYDFGYVAQGDSSGEYIRKLNIVK